MNLGDLINKSTAHFADRVAIYDDSRSLTFRALHARVNRLGNVLLDNGILPRHSIASLQYNSIETAEIELAASKFGFVRSLLNARDNLQGHINALQMIGAEALFYSGEFSSEVEALRREVPTLRICVAIDAANPEKGEYEDRVSRSRSDEPRYEVGEDWTHSVYFTSGTTGKPKGIQLSQRNWLALVRNHLVDTYSDANPRDVVLHAAPMSHASGALLFSHLVRGASQKVIRRFAANDVLDAIERDRITTLWVAPTMLIMLMEQMADRPRDTSSLRSMRYGGAAMAADRVREAVERFGPVICSGWGQWEAPQQCTFFSQDAIKSAVDRLDMARLASAGRSITFGDVAIADDEGRLLPTGEEGEVVVSGDHLMVGYVGQPAETAALRFGKWQRTGDVGRIDPEGYLNLTDRKRDLIISGGSNIYPREIEEILYTHPAVLDVAVIGLPDDKWGELVGALVVLRDGARASAQELIEWSRSQLPDYKRPRLVEFVKELPRNAYGKVVRKELKRQLEGSSQAGTRGANPNNRVNRSSP